MGAHSNRQERPARDEELEMLLAVLDRLGVEVRMEPCQSDGGVVKLAGKTILFLNSGSERTQWKALCIGALRRFDLSGIHVPPRVRQLLDGRGE